MRKLYFLLFVCYWGFGYAQLQSSIIANKEDSAVDIANSPTSSGFRLFGELPPSSSIGVLDITIPIHTIKHRDYKIPLALRYHNGMGNKVETVSGATGLGWHLTTGGTVSLIKSKKKIYKFDIEFTDGNDMILLGDNWATKQKLESLVGRVSGKNTIIDANANDTSLRGYVFALNFNGYSGEMYFDHENKPKFRTKDNKYLEANVHFASPLSTNIYKFEIIDEEGVSYVFGGEENSIEYSFLGHNNLLQVEEWDMLEQYFVYANKVKKTPVTWHLTKIIFPNKEEIKFNYAVESKFYSSKVLSDIRTLEIKNAEGKVTVTNNFEKNHAYTNEEQATIVIPVSLTQISTISEDVFFDYKQIYYSTYDSGMYNQLRNSSSTTYDDDQKAVKNICFFQSLPDMLDISILELLKPMRSLDSIRVISKMGQLTKTINFDYKANFFERLRLTEVKVTDLLREQQVESYQFKYNLLAVRKSPIPTSYNKDYFGFYNTNTDYLGYSDDENSVPKIGFSTLLYKFRDDSSLRANYIEKRAPQISAYNDWEMLNEIVYPTGGYTKFEYEPNMYGSVAKNYPFVVENNINNVEKAAGGVRIKSVKSYDSSAQLVKSKSYSYTKDYEKHGTLSSGILTHVPTYFDWISGTLSEISQSIDYFNWSSEDIYPADRLRGNHITYSEVTEIDDLDKSATVYKYKNFDNGYHDKPILEYASHFENELKDEKGALKEIWKNWDIISMGLERGQLLSEISLNKNKERVRMENYEYNDNPSRFLDYVRTVNLYDNHMYNSNSMNKSIYAFTYIASKIYTYTPYLTKKTVIDYVGANSIINSETSYKYNDTYKLVTEKTEKRGSKIFKTTYKYPFDYTDSIYEGMVYKNIVSPVILEENYINDTKVSAIKTNYFRRFDNNNYPIIIYRDPSSYLPENIEFQYKNGVWEKQLYFLLYDDKHNLLSSKDITGKTTNYLWGYRGTLPIWTVENIPYSTIKTVLGIEEINALANAVEPSTEILNSVEQKLKTHSVLRDTFQTNYLYDPVLGLTYKETPLGTKEYYKYDGFGRLIKVEDGDKNTLIEYEYNYKQN